MDDIGHIILYFFAYAFLGWVWETIYVSLQERKFVYRGFLLGPYCPIYGFGTLLLLEVLSPLKGNIPLLFVVSLLAMSVLEYLTSYVLEKLFHQRWWDYSNEPLNINGRVALKSSLFWAVMGVVIVLWLQPHVRMVADIVLSFGVWVPFVIGGIMLADATHTIVRLAGFNVLLKQIQMGINARTEHIGELVAERVNEVRRSGRPRFTERRLLKAYPRATSSQLQSFSDIRLVLLAMQRRRRTPKR